MKLIDFLKYRELIIIQPILQIVILLSYPKIDLPNRTFFVLFRFGLIINIIYIIVIISRFIQYKFDFEEKLIVIINEYKSRLFFLNFLYFTAFSIIGIDLPYFYEGISILISVMYLIINVIGFNFHNTNKITWNHLKLITIITTVSCLLLQIIAIILLSIEISGNLIFFLSSVSTSILFSQVYFLSDKASFF
ncbi:MAG: hypothetical protein INQ03_24750 [Candidatus Heimdallarchaeota archaeon]|nr:hypothetical protein [Candidatus Heimdallarchaeota archaeon]